MKLIPRSAWTAINPKPSTQGEQIKGLDFFTKDFKPEVIFERPDKDIYYIHRHPHKELNKLLKEHTLHTGLADLNYNYAISNTTRGVYVIRGKLNKCNDTAALQVLLLLGNNEAATDVLKQNQRDFLKQPLNNSIPQPNLFIGDRNIHVFDLIELLIEKGFYESRNDGYFGPLVEHGIKRLQAELELEITGVYNEWLREKLEQEEQEYIITEDKTLEPVGKNV